MCKLTHNHVRTMSALVLSILLASSAKSQNLAQSPALNPTVSVQQAVPSPAQSIDSTSGKNGTSAAGTTSPLNRYQLEQPRRPAMVPFNSTRPLAFKAVDLPPPPAPGSSPAISVSPDSRPASSAATLSSPAQDLLGAIPFPTVQASPTQQGNRELNSLPGATQLLPRPVIEGSGATNRALPDFQAGTGSATSSNSALKDIPVPSLASSKSSLASFNSMPNESSEVTPVINSNLWSTRLVAVVGTERILAGDLTPVIEPIIQENKDRIRSKQQEQEARMGLVRQLLPQFIEMKALQQEFYKDIAGNIPPRELEKKKEEIQARASKAFYEKFVSIELYRKYEVNDLASLEKKLQDNGLTITLMKNHFLMQILAMQLEEKYVAETFEIPPQEILDYYQKNIDQWRIPARVKWRELAVRFDRHPNRAAAEALIVNMGNEVILGGKPFEAVARDSSEGFTATEGGNHDWTTQGSLKSAAIDKALFANEPLKLSELIEDEVGFHIVEVLEREAAHIQDMAEIQSEIRKKLSKQMRQEKLKDFRQKVMGRVPIWSLWPEDIPGSRPLIAEPNDDPAASNN
jgi:PPIC-type PPIASE domain